jgi:hypothetical protein
MRERMQKKKVEINFKYLFNKEIYLILRRAE